MDSRGFNQLSFRYRKVVSSLIRWKLERAKTVFGKLLCRKSFVIVSNKECIQEDHPVGRVVQTNSVYFTLNIVIYHRCVRKREILFKRINSNFSIGRKFIASNRFKWKIYISNFEIRSPSSSSSS